MSSSVSSRTCNLSTPCSYTRQKRKSLHACTRKGFPEQDTHAYCLQHSLDAYLFYAIKPYQGISRIIVWVDQSPFLAKCLKCAQESYASLSFRPCQCNSLTADFCGNRCPATRAALSSISPVAWQRRYTPSAPFLSIRPYVDIKLFFNSGLELAEDGALCNL